jgi:hypothetical protein
MSTFVIVLIAILVLIYIGQKAFFSDTKDGFANSSHQSVTTTPVPTLYVFKSKTCPACQMYNTGNGPIIKKVIKELGLEIKEVDLDSENPMDLTTKNVYDKCGVEFIPTACLVKSNGEIKQLGNGNGLNKQMIESSM